MHSRHRNALLAATTAVSCVALLPAAAEARPAAKHRATDSRDARISALEAQVKALAATVEQLRAAKDQTVAVQQQQAAQQEQIAQIAAAQQKSDSEVAAVKDAVSKPKGGPAVNVSLAGGKPLLQTGDGRFSLNVHAIMQLDTGFYEQRRARPVGPVGTAGADLRRSGPALGTPNVDFAHARNLKDGTVFRRGRFGIDGTVFGDFDYKLILDFGGTGVENAGQLYEAWVQYSGIKPLHLRIGAFSPSLGLEDQASTNTMPFLERSAIEDMARGLAGGDTRTAVQLWAATDRWLAAAAVTGRTIGVINTGTASPTAPSFGDQLAFTGRLAGTPIKGSDYLVHVGVHGSYVLHPKNNKGPDNSGNLPSDNYTVAFSNTPELRADNTALINTGSMNAKHAWTTGLEFAAQKKNVFVQGEFERFGVDRIGAKNPHFHGFYAEGGWMITGEARKYNTQTGAFDGPTVAHPFSLDGGGWGAFELVARYSVADLNSREHEVVGATPATLVLGPNAIRGGKEQNFNIGLNWYPNAVVRFMLDLQHVKISRLSPCTGANTASCNTTWITPFNAEIGQSYNTIGIRSQFAF